MGITVADSAGLIMALNAATGGERIELLAGDYETVLLRDYDFDTPVTITSADVDTPTIFGGRVRVQDSEGLSFEDLHFKLADDEPVSWGAQFGVRGSKNISINDVVLEGRIATTDEAPVYEDITAQNYKQKAVADYAFGVGFTFSGSEDITLDNVDISTVRIGLSFHDVESFELVNSHLHDIRSDGVNLFDSTDVRIADNLFESFHPFRSNENPGLSDHPDFIQYWGVNSVNGIDGLEIAGNLLLQGDGSPVQAIFGRMNIKSDDPADITFTDLSIHDNLINTSHPNAIVASDWQGAEIRNNTLLPAPQPVGVVSTTDGLPRIIVTTDARPTNGVYDLTRGVLPENVTVEDNLVVGKRDGFGIRVGYFDATEMAEQDVVIGDNALLSAERTSANFWGNLFPELLDTPVSDLSGLIGLDIGGVTGLADWLVEASAQVETVSPRLVTAGDGGETLTASDLGGTLIGGAGDDVLIGGDGRDLLFGAGGDNVMTGGGRGDMFSLSAPPKGGHAVDVITDLNFDEGDHIIMGDEFPRGFFDDALDSGNSMRVFAGGSGAVLHDDGDIQELLLNERVAEITTSAGDLELHFDFDGYGGVNYVLRLEDYARADGDRTDATEPDGAVIDGDRTDVTEPGDDPTDVAGGPDTLPDMPTILGTQAGDRLVGTAAAEILDGLGGTDLYIGGGGGDILIMGDQEGDQFRGFDAALDRLDLSVWGVQSLGELSIYDRTVRTDGPYITVRDLSGSNVTFTFGEDDLTAADFTAANFIFADIADLEVIGTADDHSERLFGRAGNDLIDGGAGYNIMTGFGGDDIFVIGVDRGDVVKDFGSGADVLDLTAWGVSGLDDLRITETAGLVSIADSSRHLVRLDRAETEVSAADLTEDSFVFADTLVS